MARASLAVVVLAAATGLAGCRGSKPEPPKPPPPVVTVVRPVMYPVRDYWIYNGYLEQTKAAEVRSKVRGYLTKVEFVEGTEVKAGDPLYSIDKVEFNTALKKAQAEEKQARDKIEISKAQIVQAEAELLRVTNLFNSVTGSRADLDLAKATRDVRIAERDAAVANADAAAAARHSAEILLGYTDIKAKISGRISRTMVDEGTLVQADTTLLTTILKVDELYVNFDAPEADLVAYQQAAISSRHSDPLGRDIPVEVGVTGEDGYRHVGKIDFRENKVENATGTIRIRGKLDNPLSQNGIRLLFPGMYARVRVPKGDAVPQAVIPEDCLLSGQEGRYVYVVGSDNVAKARLVTVGATVWKAPTPVPGSPPPKWLAVNPKPPAKGEGPPPKTIRDVKAVVAVTFHEELKPDERVILVGLQQTRPNAPVAPEEWTLTPPPGAKK